MEPEILYICEKEYKDLTHSFTQSVLHCHDHIEISIILSGEAEYSIHNHSYTVKAGQLVIFNPNTYHSVVIPKQNRYRDLHLGISHLVGHLDDASQSFAEGFFIIDFKENSKLINMLTDQLVEESNACKPDCKIMLQALMLQFLVVLSRQIDDYTLPKTNHTTSFVYPDKHVVVDWITDYIKQNYMKEISLEMFAKDMYLSQVYISKIFKEATGHSPIHFLIQTRLSVAKELLETHSLPIKEVSRQVGYEDAYHFSKLFKKYYGYPPSDIRKISKSN